MKEALLDKSLKVIALDQSGPSRQLLTEVVKGAGFENVQGLSAIADLVEYLETDDADWIICSLELDSDPNALSFLQLVIKQASLRHIRVSLLAEESELIHVIPAFSLGLLSWHSKPFTKDTFEGEITELMGYVEKYEGQAPLIAAEYLRKRFREAEDYSSWCSAEKGLISMYPGRADLLLNYAESLSLSGKIAQAKTILRQAVLIDSGVEEQANQLQSTFPTEDSSTESDTGDSETINVLGIESAVVVDSDEAIQNGLKEIFEENGVATVQTFSDGEEAAAYIAKNPNPGIIIQEWKIQKLNGPNFLQRILSDGAPTTPIIVLSSLVKPKDMPLIKELGVANIVSKPFDKNDFLKALIWTLQQDRMPSDLEITEVKIRKLLKAREKDEASALISKFLEDENALEYKKELIKAEWAYYNRDFEETRDHCVLALKAKPGSVLGLNLLGKALMQLRDFEAALKCLQTAQEVSPQNIERLCNLAETQTEMGNEIEAQESLEAATDLDPDSTTVKEAKVKVALTKGDTKGAKELMERMDKLDDLVAHMNNKAVALARCESTEQSVAQYQRAIDAIPKKRIKMQSLIRYNSALAHARASNLEDAIEELEIALKNPHKKIKAKAKSLHERLKKAIETGEDFKLITSDQSTESVPTEEGGEEDIATTKSSEPNAFILDTIEPSPGDIACYLVFNLNQLGETKEYIKPIKFAKRDSIEREETGKADAALKAAS